MTPERQKWWDSLPKEEKRVRQDWRKRYRVKGVVR